MEIIDITNIFKDSLSYTWSFYMFKMNKKNGGNFSVDKINLNETYFKETLNTILNSYIDKTIDKFSNVFEYMEGIEPKGNLCYINCDDIRIKSSIESFKEAILSSTNEVASFYNGYILKGVNLNTNKELLLITKTNPLTTLNEINICPVGEVNDIKLIKLTKRIDCFIFNNILYAENLRFERIFSLTNSTRALCEANRKLVIESKRFDETTNNMFLNDKLITSFKNITIENLNNLTLENEELKLLTKYADFNFNNGIIHINNIDSTKKILKYLSNKIVFKDAKAYIATTLKPLVEINEIKE